MESGPVFGRGRGSATLTPIPTLGRGRGGFLFSPDASTPKPVFEESVVGVESSGVPFPVVSHIMKLEDDDKTERLLAGMASKIGLSIGESIASCIESRLAHGMGPNGAGSVGSAVSDSSLMNVVVRSEIKEPDSFKGDGYDTHTVQEWEAVMVAYMRKKGIPLADQAEEVLSKLVGRAREVVRVAIRSKPSLSLSGGPDPVFEILKQHFSDTVSSGMPLADFYATLPSSGEHPFDYWLRLNRAMELTEDCLRRQNKTFDNLTRDLTAMFIRHCPDPELSLIFKCKPLQQWTVAAVHERLVEHSRDQRQTSQLRLHTTITSQRQKVGAHVTPDNKFVMAPPASAPAPTLGQQAEGSADRLDRIIAMLERVLEQQPQQAGLLNRTDARTGKGQAAKAKSLGPCEICGDAGHTTRYHCRANRLCFACFTAGHTRAECPRAMFTEPRVPDPVARQEGN